MQPVPVVVLATLLALLLGRAAWTDLRARTIGNRTNAAIALLAPAWWWATGLAPWPDMALQFGLALGVFALFAIAFAAGAMGGGDVKLLGALALWLPLAPLVSMLMLMSVAGGLLSVAMLVAHRLRRAAGRPEVPYGLAIVGAAAWVMTNQMLTIPRP